MVSKRLISFIFAAALGSSCAANSDNEPNDGDVDSPLDVKHDLYISLQSTVADEDGFVEFDKCDSVHWSALTASATAPINIRAVVDDEGKLHRRPLRHGECYPLSSKSENSRDAYLMVLAYAVQHKDRQLVEDLFNYAKRSKWVTGQGPRSRTFFTPNMRAIYAQAIEHLGGHRLPEVLLPIAWSETATGYEAHLAVVSILIYGKIHGGIPDAGVKTLAAQFARQPANPLFAAAVYRYTGDEAARLAAKAGLENEAWFPIDRLPTSADRCEPWLVQRDDGASWLPCPEQGRTHSGGDFLFTEAVLSGAF